MIIYTLFYYDRPLLEAFLNHYCQFKAVCEVLIQDQNWSSEDSAFLLKTVAEYVDRYAKKIVVLPSTFKRVEGVNKRSQFLQYSQPAIRNRVLQFLQDETWIMGAIDEAIYGEGYEDTNKKLEEFEQLAENRAREGKGTVGYLPLYSAFYDGIRPSRFDFQAVSKPVCKERLFRFPFPFQHRGDKLHDTSIDVFVEGQWKRSTDPRLVDVADHRYGFAVEIPLKIIHYHTLVRPTYDSSAFNPIHSELLKNVKTHPRHYLEKVGVVI